MEKWMIWKFTLSEITQTEKFSPELAEKIVLPPGSEWRKRPLAN